MFRYLYIGFAILLIWIVILVNKILPVPLFQQHTDLINPAWENPKPFENADTLSFAFVYRNVRNHLNKPAYQNVLGGLFFRDDKKAEDYYRGLMLSDDVRANDAGSFGRAMIYNNDEIYELVLEELTKIKHTDQPYYYDALGWAYFHNGHYRDAIDAFKKELAHKYGNVNSANKGLADAYYIVDDFASIHQRMIDPVFVKNAPDYVLEKEYFLHGPILSYLRLILRMHATWDLIAAAGLIALLWGYYYTRFKIFAAKDYFLYAVVFAISCVTTAFCGVLYDAFHYLLGFFPGHDEFSLLMYDIFAVGVIEEFVKAIPVIICIVFLRKRIKEPVDYLLLATCSALAFAFMENILYFNHYYGSESYIIIHKRSVLSIIMHVFCSCVIWYGYIRATLQKRMLYLVGCVVISICTHGFYDFFLELPGSGVVYIFAVLLVVFSFFALKVFYNTALNQSSLYNATIKFPVESSSFILIAGLSLILLFEFTLNAIYFGAPHANDTLISSLLAYILLVLIYSSNLYRIILIKNHWIKMRTMFSSTYSPYRTAGSEVVLLPSNKTVHPVLYPLYGKIIDIEDYKGESDNYVIKLSTPIIHNSKTIYELIAMRAASTAVSHRIHTKLYYKSGKLKLEQDGTLSSDGLVLMDYSLMETAVEKATWLNQITWNWKSISTAVAFFLILIWGFVSFMNYSTSVDEYRAAEKSLDKLNVAAASKYCGNALYFNINNFEARMMRAKIYMDGGFYNEALRYLYFKSAIPNYIAPDYYTLQGLAYFRLKDYESASNSFLICQQQNIQFDSLYWYQSTAYEEISNPLESIKSMKLFLADKKHKSKYAYLKMGDLYMKTRQYREAYKYFDELVSEKEFYSYALLQRGICNHYMDRHVESCVDLETAHSYNDSSAINYLLKWCRVEEPDSIESGNTHE